MNQPNFKNDYLKKVRALLERKQNAELKEAEELEISDLKLKEYMAEAVGGSFDVFGYLQYQLLIQIGLQKADTLIDVGCGSGRLASQLLWYLAKGNYVGLDVVPDLYQYAKKLCPTENFKFYEAPGLNIPEPDASADMMCFFSVMTHLTHKESFLYLKDAKRVLKHQGKIVISFLESLVPAHREPFEHYANDNSDTAVLNQMVERSNFKMWCKLLNLHIDYFYTGKDNYIKIDKPIEVNNQMYYNYCSLGQSVAVLSKI